MSVLIQPSPTATNGQASLRLDLLYRFSVEQYHAMIAAGILDSRTPVELLDGWLVRKMPKNPPHRVSTRKTYKALDALLPAKWYADAQEPITTPTSEPEPDVAAIRGSTADYPDRHPGPGDVGMVVEVADSTLEYDRTVKKQIYAHARIPVYWIVNLVERLIEVYTDPSGPAEPPDYRQRRDYLPEDEIPVILEGREIGRLAVRDLLP